MGYPRPLKSSVQRPDGKAFLSAPRGSDEGPGGVGRDHASLPHLGVEREKDKRQTVVAKMAFNGAPNRHHSAARRLGIARVAGKVEGPYVKGTGLARPACCADPAIAIDELEHAPFVHVPVVPIIKERIQDGRLLRLALGIDAMDIEGPESGHAAAFGRGLLENQGAERVARFNAPGLVGARHRPRPLVLLRTPGRRGKDRRRKAQADGYALQGHLCIEIGSS